MVSISSIFSSSWVGYPLRPILSHNFIIHLTRSVAELSSLSWWQAAFTGLDVLEGGFSECSGLDMRMEVEEWHEGGNNGGKLKFPSLVTFGNISLKRGLSYSQSLWEWHHDYAKGKGKRRNGLIIMMHPHSIDGSLRLIPNNIWYFKNGLPLSYSGPRMSGSESAVAIESIEIAHEGIEQVPYVGMAATALTTVIDLAAGGG